MRINLLKHLLFIFFSFLSDIYSQSNESKVPFIGIYETPPNKDMNLSPGFIFSSAPYYNIWNTKVKFNILDIDKFANGLTPLETTAGAMTKSLLLRGGNGIKYIFRPLKKIPSTLLDFTSNQFLKSSLNDHFIIYFPYAPSIVSFLSDKIELPHTSPILCILPRSEKLDIFSEEFSFLPGYLELYISPSCKYITIKSEITSVDITSPEIFKNDSIDISSYLKMKLLDAFIGDWDRHEDQWKWVKFNKSQLWIPVAFDRDCAFTNIKGTLLHTYLNLNNYSYQTKQFNNVLDVICNYENTIKNPERLMARSYKYDLKIIPQISEKDYFKIVNDFVMILSDDVIKSAIEKIPAEVYKQMGNELYTTMQLRRNDMLNFSKNYYSFLRKQQKTN
ncbi:MAG: hypothetical protein ACD_79C00276G0005 [uncultured bacterium]|nr:MAG: hypothetical protein ACD_79C00276G0005 [uncultured bacterium]